MKLPLAIALTLCRAPSNELPCGPKSLVTHGDTAAHLLLRTSVLLTILPSHFAFFEILFQPPDLPLKSHHFHMAVPAATLSKLMVASLAKQRDLSPSGSTWETSF